MSALFTLDDLEQWRTKEEMRNIYNKAYTTVTEDKLKKYLNRKKYKTYYKELSEEYYPIPTFADRYFKNEPVQ
jgi:hypothetical protein